LSRATIASNLFFGFKGIIFGVLITMIFLVYIKTYSSDQIYDLLLNTVSKTDEECAALFTYGEGHEKEGQSFFGDPADRTYSCGPIDGNRDGSYLTMLSSGGLMFGLINIVGNFGTVFVDQSYWQSAIAARPESAARGYLLGG
jgi:urea-proton symporter